VLPVVVAALEPSSSLVAIEQPELHIHPAVQVGLGDLFIKGAKEHGISFLIETHSEHLILRLLRRIRETAEGELPPDVLALKTDDVSVMYVQPGEGGVKLIPLPIDETGEFTTRWPKGFFDERAEELF
jgi:predicted ATPase